MNSERGYIVGKNKKQIEIFYIHDFIWTYDHVKTDSLM